MGCTRAVLGFTLATALVGWLGRITGLTKALGLAFLFTSSSVLPRECDLLLGWAGVGVGSTGGSLPGTVPTIVTESSVVLVTALVTGRMGSLKSGKILSAIVKTTLCSVAI